MKVTPYTRTVIAPRAVPQMTTGQIEGGEMMQVSQLAGGVADKIDAVVQKKQTRYETIQRARTVSAFKNEVNDDFTKFASENDMTDPNAPKVFSEQVRNKMAAYLEQHDGGEDSRASLEIQLGGLSDEFSMRMSEGGRAAQKQFITRQIGGHIDRISREVYNNPNSMETAFKQLDGLFQEYSPAVDSVEEMQMLSNAQSMIVENAINSFVDAGDYEGARDMIEANDYFVQTMPAKQQMSLLSRVNQGIAAQEKERNEMRNKIKTMQSAAQELGVEVSPTQIFSAATGIDQGSTPQQKLDDFAKITNTTVDKLTPSVIAKIGFGADLPSAEEVDMNKERRPDGGYTPKGIGVVIKPKYDMAANTKIMVDKVIKQADEFINTDNKQAGLASMISFQKLIDDGAAVREGDIKLSAQGNSALDNIQLIMSKVVEGGIATPKQIEEMKASAEIFGKSVLEAAKTDIDPFLQDGTEKGYRLIDMGLPQQAYDRVFKGINTAEDENKRNSDIEEKAKAAGMTVNQYFTSTAKKHKMTVEEVAKRLGYTGKYD